MIAVVVAEVATRDERRGDVAELARVFAECLDGQDTGLRGRFDERREVVDRKERAADVVLDDRVLECVKVAAAVCKLGEGAPNRLLGIGSVARRMLLLRDVILNAGRVETILEVIEKAEERSDVVGVKNGGAGSAAWRHIERRHDAALLANATPKRYTMAGGGGKREIVTEKKRKMKRWGWGERESGIRASVVREISDRNWMRETREQAENKDDE